jgi:hypothetical protein
VCAKGVGVGGGGGGLGVRVTHAILSMLKILTSSQPLYYRLQRCLGPLLRLGENIQEPLIGLFSHFARALDMTLTLSKVRLPITD